jgi:subtilisin family serine protease
VINASFGGGDYSQAVADAIGYAGSHGVVFVTAAGNSGTNDDTTPFYPASYRLPNEIVVTAVGESGSLPAFADYGRKSVDLAAPGVNILSTMPDGSYAYMSGTSMAAPYVTGVVSLVAGLHPTWTPEQVIQQVLATAKPLSGLTGKTVTGGIVDAARAVGVGHPSTHGMMGKHAVATNLRSRSGSSPKHAIPAGPVHHPISARARVRPGHVRPDEQIGQSLALSQSS